MAEPDSALAHSSRTYRTNNVSQPEEGGEMMYQSPDTSFGDEIMYQGTDTSFGKVLVDQGTDTSFGDGLVDVHAESGNQRSTLEQMQSMSIPQMETSRSTLIELELVEAKPKVGVLSLKSSERQNIARIAYFATVPDIGPKAAEFMDRIAWQRDREGKKGNEEGKEGKKGDEEGRKGENDPGWKLRKPELLISVVGGASNFRTSQMVYEQLTEGLKEVASSTDVWFISSGYETGVMKMVGNARRKYFNDAPLIGILPTCKVCEQDFHHFPGEIEIDLLEKGWRQCLMKEEENRLPMPMEAVSECRQFDNRPRSRYRNLDPNHSHFFLCEWSKQSREHEEKCNCHPGTEVTARAYFQQKLVGQHFQKPEVSSGVPLVLVVVHGSLGTLATVHDHVQQAGSGPVLLIKGSGQATDLLGDLISISAVRHERKQSEQENLPAEEELSQVQRKLLGWLVSLKDKDVGGAEGNGSSQLWMAAQKFLKELANDLSKQLSSSQSPQGARFDNPRVQELIQLLETYWRTIQYAEWKDTTGRWLPSGKTNLEQLKKGVLAIKYAFGAAEDPKRFHIYDPTGKVGFKQSVVQCLCGAYHHAASKYAEQLAGKESATLPKDSATWLEKKLSAAVLLYCPVELRKIVNTEKKKQLHPDVGRVEDRRIWGDFRKLFKNVMDKQLDTAIKEDKPEAIDYLFNNGGSYSMYSFEDECDYANLFKILKLDVGYKTMTLLEKEQRGDLERLLANFKLALTIRNWCTMMECIPVALVPHGEDESLSSAALEKASENIWEEVEKTGKKLEKKLKLLDSQKKLELQLELQNSERGGETQMCNNIAEELGCNNIAEELDWEGMANEFTERSDELQKSSCLRAFEDIVINYCDDSLGYDMKSAEPAFNLLMWSLLANCKNKQSHFVWWKATRSPVVAALTACLLCRTLSRSKDIEPHLQNGFSDTANFFEELAIQVQSNCQNEDRPLALMSLEHERGPWKSMTMVDVAVISESERFVEACCEEAIDQRFGGDLLPYGQKIPSPLSFSWMQGLKRTVFFHCCCLGLLAPLCMKYHEAPESEFLRHPTQIMQSPGSKANTDDRGLFSGSGRNRRGRDCTRSKTPVSYWVKWRCFWEAPVTLFVADESVRLGIRVVFTWFVFAVPDPYLFHPWSGYASSHEGGWRGIFPIEFVMLALMTTNFITELVQLWLTFGRYWDGWNATDLLVPFIFGAGFAVHTIYGSEETGERVFAVLRKDLWVYLYSVCCFFLWVRFLRAFSASKRFGPLVILIWAMGKDIVNFVLVYAILLVAFTILLKGSNPDSFRKQECSEKEGFYMCWDGWWFFRSLFQAIGANMYLEEMHTYISVAGLVLLWLGMNLLLLNVVIAIMNNSYAKMQEKSERKFLVDMYQISIEYSRSCLAAPLPVNVMYTIYEFARFLYHRSVVYELWDSKERRTWRLCGCIKEDEDLNGLSSRNGGARSKKEERKEERKEEKPTWVVLQHFWRRGVGVLNHSEKTPGGFLSRVKEQGRIIDLFLRRTTSVTAALHRKKEVTAGGAGDASAKLTKAVATELFWEGKLNSFMGRAHVRFLQSGQLFDEFLKTWGIPGPVIADSDENRDDSSKPEKEKGVGVGGTEGGPAGTQHEERTQGGGGERGKGSGQEERDGPREHSGAGAGRSDKELQATREGGSEDRWGGEGRGDGDRQPKEPATSVGLTDEELEAIAEKIARLLRGGDGLPLSGHSDARPVPEEPRSNVPTGTGKEEVKTAGEGKPKDAEGGKRSSDAAAATLKKGDTVWYTRQDGSRTEAEIVSIDHALQPPSYVVKVDGRERETERQRLEPRSS